jgi:hypothetical protein
MAKHSSAGPRAHRDTIYSKALSYLGFQSERKVGLDDHHGYLRFNWALAVIVWLNCDNERIAGSRERLSDGESIIGVFLYERS